MNEDIKKRFSKFCYEGGIAEADKDQFWLFLQMIVVELKLAYEQQIKDSRIAEREKIKQSILSHSGYGDEVEFILKNIADQLDHLTNKELTRN